MADETDKNVDGREYAENCEELEGCDRESCEGCPYEGQEGPQSMQAELNIFSEIRHVIGIVSGKGGVGKSMVTGSLANLLTENGYRVGILDADITGPSIPQMYGLTGLAEAQDEMVLPMETDNGIKVMSINLLLPDPESPVIWRGPILAGMITQFWQDVIWGDLDYLLVDMPPGTGDVPLTVFQSLPVDGIFIVTSPQDLVRLIVKKAYNMAREMNIPVLGIIENYSYMLCPHCGEKIPVFGESKLKEVADEMQLLVGGQIPMDPELSKLSDEGRFSEEKNSYLERACRALEILSVKD